MAFLSYLCRYSHAWLERDLQPSAGRENRFYKLVLVPCLLVPIVIYNLSPFK
ncbi:hypothetical protein BDQ12DRAFT_687249 [Crucibulum laeve]|uniref:Uncharacterized protein n=1 Tax=Crucibulum laeve TaxID=68775 RepID=A0A5C3LTG5_9AGAR|nr:hypothetical protein BDQ12DRAFT_687249 [Crucibulum laeve]